jgi:hypothetical protein
MVRLEGGGSEAATRAAAAQSAMPSHGPAARSRWTGGYVGDGEDTQVAPICLASWLVISTLRGLAASCTGMARVSTPAV